MQAIEFKSKIKDNQILIPARIKSKLKSKQNEEVRVIVLIEDKNNLDDIDFVQTTKSQFLQGYSEADAIYDTYPK